MGENIHESAYLPLEIERRIRLLWACLTAFGPGLYDMATVPLILTARILTAEATDTLPYRCVTRTLSVKPFATLRRVHH